MNRAAVSRLIDEVTALWPQHGKFLKTSFQGRSLEQQEDDELLANLILRITGEKTRAFCESYRWLCEEFQKEELEFRRSNRYRGVSQVEVEERVYGNAPYMKKYMEGLLVSQLLWSNHAGVFSTLRRRFFRSFQAGFRHLEVGPGHGLFLYLASASGAGHIQAWDVSATSLQQTRDALSRLDVKGPIVLELRNASDGGYGKDSFDSIVMSEVLEHMEAPQSFLEAVRPLLAPGGKVFVNVPINSPAPDHIFLLRSPEEARSLVEEAGYRIDAFEPFPSMGLTLNDALKKQASISCVMVATTPR